MLIATLIDVPLVLGAVVVGMLAVAVVKSELELKQTTQPKSQPLTDQHTHTIEATSVILLDSNQLNVASI